MLLVMNYAYFTLISLELSTVNKGKYRKDLAGRCIIQ